MEDVHTYKRSYESWPQLHKPQCAESEFSKGLASVFHLITAITLYQIVGV